MSDYNEVSKRAYELWENAGKPDGKDNEFWLQAEREVHQGSNGQTQTSGRSLQSPRGARPVGNRTQ
jgi:hypothetical protein